MLINQTICEERVVIYEAEKDAIKKTDGEIVTFAEERKKATITNGSLLEWCYTDNP